MVCGRSRDNTPAPLLNMDKEHEEMMINNFRSEMEAKLREKEREQQQEKAEEEEEEASPVTTEAFETVETEPTPQQETERQDTQGDIKVEVSRHTSTGQSGSSIC